jgi:uncharacterized alpha/beta hydrolase family protein
MKNINKIQITNADKSAKLQTKARKALMVSAGRDWENSKLAVEAAAKLLVKGANLARQVGIKMIEAAGHEQISFEWFHNHAEDLPKGMTFPALKKCVHIAKHFEGEIKDMNQVRQVQQSLFEAFGQADAPKRIEDQTPHESNPWSEFISGAASFTRMFDDLDTDRMDDWGRDKLTKFVETTKPIVEKHNQAVDLLK